MLQLLSPLTQAPLAIACAARSHVSAQRTQSGTSPQNLACAFSCQVTDALPIIILIIILAAASASLTHNVFKDSTGAQMTAVASAHPRKLQMTLKMLRTLGTRTPVNGTVWSNPIIRAPTWMTQRQAKGTFSALDFALAFISLTAAKKATPGTLRLADASKYPVVVVRLSGGIKLRPLAVAYHKIAQLTTCSTIKAANATALSLLLANAETVFTGQLRNASASVISLLMELLALQVSSGTPASVLALVRPSHAKRAGSGTSTRVNADAVQIETSAPRDGTSTLSPADVSKNLRPAPKATSGTSTKKMAAAIVRSFLETVLQTNTGTS